MGPVKDCEHACIACAMRATMDKWTRLLPPLVRAVKAAEAGIDFGYAPAPFASVDIGAPSPLADPWGKTRPTIGRSVRTYP